MYFIVSLYRIFGVSFIHSSIYYLGVFSGTITNITFLKEIPLYKNAHLAIRLFSYRKKKEVSNKQNPLEILEQIWYINALVSSFMKTK